MSAPAAAPVVYRGLINEVSQQVVESISGLLLSSPHLRALDGGREIKVLVRADWPQQPTNKVGLLSGGGDGHAPAHAGFVGQGMLSAAVSGEVFASPSVSAVLACIRSLARPAGTSEAVPRPVLLIVKNYTGDCLNFGLAMSQAALEGVPVEMVVVGDDVALPRSKGVTGRRGVAGTVLVHKIAGAAAEQGLSLTEVAKRADQAARSIVSLGVATAACNVPGAAVLAEGRLKLGMCELGMGIHNEQGSEQLPLGSAHEIVARMITQLLSNDEQRDYFHRHSASEAARPLGGDIVLMVNNLGSATATELNIFVGESLRLLAARGLRVRRLLVGTFMTALDMKGVSLSIMRLAEDQAERDWQLAAIDAPTEATGWPKLVVRDPKAPESLPVPTAPIVAAASAEASNANAVANLDTTVSTQLLVSLADTILSHSVQLNELDALSGDGDCGSTLSLGASSIHALAKDGRLASACSLPQLFQLLASGVGDSMGGSSGALLQILLTAAASGAQSNGDLPTPLQLAKALEAGVAAVSRFGGATVGDRTMLDALVPAVSTFASQLASSASPADACTAAAQAARTGATSTRAMVARAGRANYVSGEALAREDPGAEATALLWEAAASCTVTQQ